MCCLIRGASGAPKVAVPKTAVPKTAGSATSKETSPGCILSVVSKSNLTLNVGSAAPSGFKDTLT